jgi:hypothetical protein
MDHRALGNLLIFESSPCCVTMVSFVTGEGAPYEAEAFLPYHK